MRRVVGALAGTVFALFAASAARAQTSFTPQTQAQLLSAFSDLAPPASITPQTMRNFVGSTIISPVAAGSASIASGFGTTPAIAGAGNPYAFLVTIGSGGTASTGTLTMPAATNGWACSAADVTTQSSSVFLTKETAYTTTSVTLTQYNTAGAATAWVAGDKVVVKCSGF